MLFGWNLTVENTTFSSIFIRWTNLTNVLNRKVGHYVVFLNRRNNSVSLHQVVDGDQLTTEINGLTYSTNYTVEVVGIDAMRTPYKTPQEATTTANRKRRNATVFFFFFLFLVNRGRTESWILEKVLTLVQLFSLDKGKVLKQKNGTCNKSWVFFLLKAVRNASQVILFYFFFSYFFFPSVSIDHIFDNLESGKRIYHFVKRLEKVLTLGSEIWTNPVLMIRKVLKLGTFNFSDCEEWPTSIVPK